MWLRSSKTSIPACLVILLAGLLVPALTGCGGGGSADAERTLAVSAASSLKAALTEIGTAFDSANDCKTSFNFDGSGILQQQIEAGAPVDVFASAAMSQVAALAEKGLVDSETITVFASNEMIILVPSDSTLDITGFEDLTRPEVRRIAYGDPAAAPHGVAAEEILRALDIYDQVKPKVIYAANATQTLQFVASGEVDAAIAFASEALVGGDAVKVVATSDPSWHSEIEYPMAVVSSSGSKALATEFIDFVAGREAQDILQRYGLVPAPGTQP